MSFKENLFMVAWELIEKWRLMPFFNYVTSNEFIDVKPDNVVSDSPLGYGDWWNFGAYKKSWEILETHPDTPPNELPIFNIMWHIGLMKGNKDPYNTALFIERQIKLFYAIKNEGYKPQGKPIHVFIGAKGEIILRDGHHRISMLQALKHKTKIPVKVKARHPEWQSLKKKAFILYNRKLLYQPIEHPDFDDWTVDRQCTDRLESIVNYLGDVNGKTGLDIGSNTGWFCHKLSERGAKMTGVDVDPVRIDISKTLSKNNGFSPSNPRFIKTRFEDFINKDDTQYDFILLLSLLHHYIRKDPQKGIDALNLIQAHTETLFLEVDEKLPFTWDSSWVLDNTKFKKIERLESKRRPLYVVTN